MNKPLHDHAIQAAWRGANDRQYCTEFGCEHKYFWMLREMARAIDPSVDSGLGSNGARDDISRPTCFVFRSQALAEVFADNAITLPDRILRFLHGTNPTKQDGHCDGSGRG